MKDRKTKLEKESAPKLPIFRDLLPDLKGVGQLWVSDLLAKVTTEMVLLAKTKITANDKKSIVSKLDLELGSGTMCHILLEVVALIKQVSEFVADGNDPSKVFEYVNGLFIYAAYKHGSTGRQLLYRVVVYLKDDLLDCKTDTVFDRRRAA